MKSLSIVLIIILCLGVTAMAQQDVKKEDLAGHTLYTVLSKGDIPGIYDPVYVDGKSAAVNYYDDEPVMVVKHNGITHAYSTWHLDHHEIVNDKIGDIYLAATW